MMPWVKIDDVGDTEFLIDEQVDKFRFLEENERVISDGGRPAQGRPLPMSRATRHAPTTRQRSGRSAPQVLRRHYAFGTSSTATAQVARAVARPCA